MTVTASSPWAALLAPAVRWDPYEGYEPMRPKVDEWLALGVGGLVVHGGDQEAARVFIKDVRRRSRQPLLVGADLERGAGQIFGGATGVPPHGALAELGDVDAVRRAARLAAREARTLGVNWGFAPVCDLDLLAANPVVGSRSFGADPAKVSELVVEWIDACQAEGVLACAKHFPGHGRTAEDAQLSLPVVSASEDALRAHDMVPFRAAIDAGVASMMTANVAYPALDASGAPATLSREMLRWLLRQQLRFEGLIVSDALDARGLRAGREEGAVAVQALLAGCDILLHVEDVAGVARAIEQAVASRQLDRELLSASLRRRLKWAQWASPPNEYRKPSAADVAWGAQLSDRVIRLVQGETPTMRTPVEVVVVDDDLEEAGEPGSASRQPPSREPFFAALRAGGVQARAVDRPVPGGRGTLVVALFGDVRTGKGRVGYADASLAAVRDAVAAARESQREAVVVQFGHPRLDTGLDEDVPVLSAWGGDAAMQAAAARWLLARR